MTPEILASVAAGAVGLAALTFMCGLVVGLRHGAAREREVCQRLADMTEQIRKQRVSA